MTRLLCRMTTPRPFMQLIMISAAVVTYRVIFALTDPATVPSGAGPRERDDEERVLAVNLGIRSERAGVPPSAALLDVCHARARRRDL